MPHVEVTKKTFESVFISLDQFKTEHKELVQKMFYFNQEKQQRGLIVFNYISNINQYFITDINF